MAHFASGPYHVIGVSCRGFWTYSVLGFLDHAIYVLPLVVSARESSV